MLELVRDILLAALFFVVAAALTSGRGFAQDPPRHAASGTPHKEVWLRKKAALRRCSYERIADDAEVRVCRIAVRS